MMGIEGILHLLGVATQMVQALPWFLTPKLAKSLQKCSVWDPDPSSLFQVVDRQDIVIDEEAETVAVASGSVPIPPEAWESGWKDTVIAYPGQVTRVRMRFDVPGQYVWHCHIVEHEDNERMRPYRIGPEQPGQPATDHHGHG